MKILLPFLLFFSQLSFAQQLTQKEIHQYVKTIDSLRTKNKLVKVDYPNMHYCGGGVDGYYQSGKLVLLDATYQAELGFSRRVLYLKDEVFVRIHFQQHPANWEQYEQDYPNDRYTWDPSKMTYSDTSYSITLSSPIKFNKMVGNTGSMTIDTMLIHNLIACGNEMRIALEEVINQVDSLKFITEMPYICEMGPCGDPLFWEAVKLGKSGIELLIDKLDDSTSTQATVALFGYTFTTADIAYVALSEIIHDIPTFELLGVPFDTNGCGYCAYWQFLNADYKNRQTFKLAVLNWYHANKNQLVWVENNAFESCDCAFRHPNGGHYEVEKQ